MTCLRVQCGDYSFNTSCSSNQSTVRVAILRQSAEQIHAVLANLHLCPGTKCSISGLDTAMLQIGIKFELTQLDVKQSCKLIYSRFGSQLSRAQVRNEGALLVSGR